LGFPRVLRPSLHRPHAARSTLARAGRRERLVARTAAPGVPLDNGNFDIVEEPLDAPDPRPPSARALVKLRRPGG
jgi:hypothetical protein